MMNRFVTLLIAFGGRLFNGFIRSRLRAEMLGADEQIQARRDHRSDDPRTGGGFPAVGVL